MLLCLIIQLILIIFSRPLCMFTSSWFFARFQSSLKLRHSVELFSTSSALKMAASGTTADPASIYSFSAKDAEGHDVSLEKYRLS